MRLSTLLLVAACAAVPIACGSTASPTAPAEALEAGADVVVPELEASTPEASTVDADASPVVSPVPPAFQDLYTALDTQLSAFETTIDARVPLLKPPVAFSAELLTMNGNRGKQLIAPATLQGMAVELDRLAALGVRAVTFNIPFPLLYAPFHTFAAFDRDALLAVYDQVFSAVRAKGLLVVIESHALFSGYYSQGAGFDVATYYPTLTTDEYLAGRLDVIQTIATRFQPDILSVAAEPDTEKELTGKPVDSPAVQADFAAQAAQAVADAGSPTQVTAGIGTWHPGAASYVTALCQVAALPAIDLHVYPINAGLLDTTLALADAIVACGKKPTLTEAWLLKERDTEFKATSNATDPTIFTRDSFSFWAPLDTKFLRVMAKLAWADGFTTMSAFWSRYFHAYIDYGTWSSKTPQEIEAAANQAAVQAMLAKTFSPTGTAWKALVTAP